MPVREWFSGKVFQWVHGHHLVYNTCWEDPRLDRIALALTPEDKVLVITSAGCNALDYALAGAGEVHAVDVNPRQNALLELKLAGIRNLRYEDFFAMFGRGQLDRAGKVYAEVLRPSLSPWSQQYWDRWIEFFEAGNSRPFYFRGASGGLARMFNWYIDHVAKLREWLDAILSVRTLEEQREIYENHIHDRFWSRPVRFAVGRDALLSMAGVPRPNDGRSSCTTRAASSNSSTIVSKPSSPDCPWPTTTFGASTSPANIRRIAVRNTSSRRTSIGCGILWRTASTPIRIRSRVSWRRPTLRSLASCSWTTWTGWLGPIFRSWSKSGSG